MSGTFEGAKRDKTLVIDRRRRSDPACRGVSENAKVRGTGRKGFGNTHKVGIFISNISEGRNVSWLFETFAFEIALSHADAFRLSGARFCTRPGSMSLRYPSSMTLPVVPENKSDSRNAGGVAILQMDEKGLLH